MMKYCQLFVFPPYVVPLRPLPPTFFVLAGREPLEITVEDDNAFINDFLGFVSIMIEDLVDKKKQTGW